MSPFRHALVVFGAATALYVVLFWTAAFGGGLLAESDLYEYFLPIFVSPLTFWSNFEFAGFPAFADPQDASWYPLHFLFARIIGSWSAFIASAYVLASCFAYAYVFSLTRSIAASAAAALAFGLCEALMARTPHLAFLHAIVWLPLILLAIDKLRGPARGRWLAIGAGGVGCCMLAGHPQAVAYSLYWAALYAAVGGFAERAERSYYGSAIAMFVLGGLLAAVKAVPLYEASSEVAREAVSYGMFVAHGNTPVQLLTMVFPAILHEGREAPTYVGLPVLAFAFVGAARASHNWRAGFWLFTIAVSLLLGLGDTPVTRLAYQIPLYDKFRVVARHLFLGSFGAIALAGIGIAALREGKASRRLVVVACLAVAGLLALGLSIFLTSPALVRFEVDARMPEGSPLWRSHAWRQLGLFLATVSVAWSASIGRFRKVWPVALLATLGLDLFFNVTPAGLRSGLISRQELEPTVHARQLAAELGEGHHRLLPIGGSATDALAPGALARLWAIPSAGGYGPMLLARHQILAEMGNNGSVQPLVLGAPDLALDLLSVKYVAVRTADVASQGQFQRAGLLWERPGFEMPVGRPDCSSPHPGSASLSMPVDVAISEIAIVGYLRCSEHLTQGQEFGQITVIGRHGETIARPLRAGVELAEQELGDPSVRQHTRHGPATVFEVDGARLEYLFRLRLDDPMMLQRLEFRSLALPGWLTIDRVTLVDALGQSLPQVYPAVLLRDESRWRAVRRFRTSRYSDRRVDEDVPNEDEYTIFENRRVMPRAWMVPRVVALEAPDLLQAIRLSQLPDGSPFDPRTTALVERGRAPAITRFTPGANAVRVEEIADGRVVLAVSTEHGGFLVLSDTYYPGWRAFVDGEQEPVYPTDLSLRGIIVPAGQHQVIFTLVPFSLYLGATLSVMALAIVGVVWARSAQRSDVS